MRTFFLVLGSILFTVSASAAPANIQLPTPSFWSKSKQFSIAGSQTKRILPESTSTNEVKQIALTAPEMAMTCERVKEQLLRALDLRDYWRGRIYVRLHPVEASQGELVYESMLFTDGWHYRLHVPDVVEPVKLIRAIVQVLLLEIANRDSRGACAEVPIWLREGLTEILMSDVQGETLVVQTTELKEEVIPNIWRVDPVNQVVKRSDPSARSKEWLRDHAGLAFADLNLPARDQLSGEQWKTYRASAHVFVTELLELPQGPQSLAATIQYLPSFLNNQFALLRGFKHQFPTVLDLEKWWSVTMLSAVSRDSRAKLTITDGLAKLDQILRAQVEVSGNTNALPQRADMTIQSLLERADFDVQKSAIQTALRQLELLQLEAPGDLLNLVQDYRVALIVYLQKREKGAPAGGKIPATSLRLATREAIRQLDLLDSIRSDLQRLDARTPAVAGTAAVSP